MHTVIAICTYQRPLGLNRLLDHIALLSLPEELSDRDISVVVVDNHIGKEGLDVCEQRAPDFRFPLRAICQPGNGISDARNTAVEMALSAKPNFVGFLDDDEWPTPNWLCELLQVLAKSSADVVGGPTESVFPSHAPTELRSNPYYGADMALADGTPCTLQAAGNFLIRASCLSHLAPNYFHIDFAHSGGEDLAFFTQLENQGFPMVWASKAVVYEEVPENRLTQDWLRTRVINIANSRVRVMQMLKPGILASLVRGAKTLALGFQVALYAVLGLVSPKFAAASEQLRWKFIGKASAHLKRKTIRPEGH